MAQIVNQVLLFFLDLATKSLSKLQYGILPSLSWLSTPDVSALGFRFRLGWGPRPGYRPPMHRYIIAKGHPYSAGDQVARCRPNWEPIL